LSKINGPEGLKIRKIRNESVAGGRISRPGPGNLHLKGERAGKPVRRGITMALPSKNKIPPSEKQRGVISENRWG